MNLEHFFEWETHQIHVSSEFTTREGNACVIDFPKFKMMHSFMFSLSFEMVG